MTGANSRTRKVNRRGAPRLPTRARAEYLLTGDVAAALETGRTRLLVAGVIFALAFAVVGGRLVDLALWGDGAVPRVAQSSAPGLGHGRADIVDRHGVVLATSVPTASLYADPNMIRDPAETAAALAEILSGESYDEIFGKLSSDRDFVWIKRNLTPRDQHAVNSLGFPGLDFRHGVQRIYPNRNLAAHVVGFSNIDTKGLAGIERAFDKTLKTSDAPLRLSLDVRVQHVLTEELAAAMQTFDAVGAAGVVLDVRNGETLAMASLPDFDPNQARVASADQRFNRASLGLYEMGSVFKIFTTAQALDSGAVKLNDGFDTSKPIRVARYTINDYKPKNRRLSIPEIFIYSSNIGTAHMAMEIGTRAQQDFLSGLGLTRETGIELGEVSPPLLPSPWREINTLTISYGHGIAVSPIQVASAVSAIVNGGELIAPTLLRRDPEEPLAGERVISEATSRVMGDLMRLVVRQGTGRKADSKGYLVGGKTGTSDKLVKGRYARNKRMASFVGAFPMNDPRYVVLIMVDEPKGTKETHNYATGGWVAAPAMRNVVERIAPILGIAPAADGFETETSERLLRRTLKRAQLAKAQRIAAN